MERLWWAENFEKCVTTDIGDEQRLIFAKLMVLCQEWDHYLQLKFATVKRYGCEGAESMLPFFHSALSQASCENTHAVICMAHRGRLNLLAVMLDLDPLIMFRKMRGMTEYPDEVDGSGDVLSHLTSTTKMRFGDKSIKVSMLANPSHLEAVNPVAMGTCRAKTLKYRLGDYSKDVERAKPGDGVLCVQVHGDAAFSGQGVVWESLAMSQVPHFRVGGSVHLVTNNQIGYTAEATVGRSSRHVTDAAKGVDCPVLHVNADCPASASRAAKLAVDYRQRFRKDVFVNLICFRKYGHNELDDPTFTQPIMYQSVQSRKSIPDNYCDLLSQRGVLSSDDVQKWKADNRSVLQGKFASLSDSAPVATHLQGTWSSMRQAPNVLETWDTGVDVDTLRFVASKSVAVPENFTLHGHLEKHHTSARIAKITEGDKIDWSTAEAMAFGSLMLQGHNVRISGQDVGRGTFSQRHCMLVDQRTDQIHVPLNHMTGGQAHLEVANSLLSEQAVVAFEYGFSIESPNNLVIWEAQFGDFFNGAQITLDTFVSSGEAKWLYQSGLVLVLPHGVDGMGPEHSSARIERFLQLSDSSETRLDGENVNWHVVNPTTPAQYFHTLRRQQVRDYRKPLVVVGPKMLLRHPMCVSRMSDMAPRTHFKTVIGDQTNQTPENVRKVIVCSGKHYYTLVKHLSTLADADRRRFAIVRLEQLCPFPAGRLNAALAPFKNATEFIYSQEEPRNQGAWNFIYVRVKNMLNVELKYVGRKEMPFPATAIGKHHSEQDRKLLEDTFAM